MNTASAAKTPSRLGVYLTFCSATVLSIFMSTGLAHAQVAEDKLNLEYDFIGGGLRILAATFDLTFDQKTYLVKSQLTTKGIANLFTKSISYLGARGTLNARQPLPAEFQSRVENNNGYKTSHIIWQSKNKQRIDVLPKPNSFRQASIDKLLKSTFPDPLSALVAITFSKGQLCRNKIRSFDGRKVFDFKLEYLGKEMLHKGEAGSYFGPAHKCHFNNIPVAGYSKKRMKEHRKKPTPAYTVWFAPVNSAATRKTIYVPVKATGTINWASVSVMITKGTLNGLPLSATH